MNYLISAYAIDPYLGSESGVGWNWVLQYERNYKVGDKITVLTKKANEDSLRRGISEFGLLHVDVAVCDVPKFLNWYREKNSLFHHMYYILWQYQAWKWLKKSKRHYDIIHHVTWGDYRIPSEFYRAKDAYTIWGPVGGAQVTPVGLKQYDTPMDRFREFVNKVTVLNPIYKRKIRSFSKIFASNIETYNAISKISYKNCSKLVEIGGGYETSCGWKNNEHQNDRIVLLYVGRLIKKKGIEFLIEALKKLPLELNYVCKIYGEGSLDKKIEKMIIEYGLSDKVFMMGYLPFDEIDNAYKGADIFLMPSLRETGGTVLVEAMSHYLPIVALDQSFCHELSLNKCGLFIDTSGSAEEITNDYSQAIIVLINNSEMRKNLGMNGYNFFYNQLTWSHKFNVVYREVQQEGMDGYKRN